MTKAGERLIASAKELRAMTAPAPAVDAGLVERLNATQDYDADQKTALAALAHHIISPHLNEFTGEHARSILAIMARVEAPAREAASALSSLQEQVEALTRDRDEARAHHEYFAIEADNQSHRAEASEAEVTRLRQRVEEQDRTVDFVTRWCWRENVSDRDRMEAIKWHPAIHARTKEPNNV